MVTRWVARGGAIIGTLQVFSCGLFPRPGSGQTGGGGKGSGWWL